jgi:two-component system alkaline phosphatase synthesis response regulator PhoP
VPTVLIVDDEPKIQRIAREYFESAGFAAQTVADGEAALASARADEPDLVVLDLSLPGMDGLDVCRQLRKTSNVPILMLTARDAESDKLVGLELGADDYITKPFSPKELVARARAVLRRAAMAEEPRQELRAGDIKMDLARMKTTVAGRMVELTATEFDLLATLVRQPGRVFTRAQLLDAIHGVAIESYERAIDAHIKNLRRKLEPDPRQPRYLQTVYGVGYRFNDDA